MTRARGEARPSEEEIGRIRSLISRVKAGIEDLTAEGRTGVEEAVEVVRRHRAVTLGMPGVRRVPVDLRPPRR